MRKKKYKYKILFICLIGIVIIISLFIFINDNNSVLDNLKKVSANIFYKENNNILSNNVLENEIKDLNKEINELKEINDIDSLLTDKRVINASIIKRSPNYWYDIITINKGSKNGVKRGDGVISNNGLIGEVIIANNNTSEVRLICNTSNNYLSSKFNYNDIDYYGIIKKYNLITNELYMENVVGDIDNVIGLDVITSGLSSNIPSGLLIGKIKDIEIDKYNLSHTIIIEPSANFNDINIVRVVGND